MKRSAGTGISLSVHLCSHILLTIHGYYLHHQHRIAVMDLGHFSTRSGVTHPEFLSVVFPGSFSFLMCTFLFIPSNLLRVSLCFADRASQYNLSNYPTWCTKSCFIISLLNASTCFERYVLINRRSKLYYTASVIITPVDGHLVHRLRED